MCTLATVACTVGVAFKRALAAPLKEESVVNDFPINGENTGGRINPDYINKILHKLRVTVENLLESESVSANLKL